MVRIHGWNQLYLPPYPGAQPVKSEEERQFSRYGLRAKLYKLKLSLMYDYVEVVNA